VRRTPICALATELPLRGTPTGLSAELFASTLDVYLTLGDTAPDPKDHSTADGRPATVAAARDRLSRMVGADREDFSREDAQAFARAADECLLNRLATGGAAERACRPTVGRPPLGGRLRLRRVPRPEAGAAVDRAGRADRRAQRGVGRGCLERRLRPCAARPGGGRAGPRRRGRGGVIRPVVVKVGGSLFDWPELPAELAGFLATRGGDRLVLVAGGGPATDLVRTLDRVHGLGQERAHQLATHSLDLTARLLVALLPGLAVVVEHAGSLEECWDDGLLPVLAPRSLLEEDDRSADPLPHTWDATSDSIAARVAVRLGACELVLLKSASLPPGTDRPQAVRLGLVDPVFPAAARGLGRVAYLCLREPADVRRPAWI